MVDTPFSHFS